jgi:uncharacterized protein
MNKLHNITIERFTTKAKKILKNNLVDVLVYGSVARGEAKEESDIDVIVIVKRNAFKTQMKLAALAFDILMETGEYISVQTLKSKELERDTIFLHNVRSDAIHAL